MRSATTALQRWSCVQSRRVYLPLLFGRGQQNMANGAKHQLVEEQKLSWLRPKRYYPVRIGDVYKQRYRIIAKLGYGAYSTVWLAEDQR